MVKKMVAALITVIAIAVLSVSCTPLEGNFSGPDGGGDKGQENDLPPSFGINEVQGKILYLEKSPTIVFSTDSFEIYWRDKNDYIFNGNGSYSYNSEDKTITLAIDRLTRGYFELINFNETNENDLLTKIQAGNAAVESVEANLNLSLNDFLKSWGVDDDEEYQAFLEDEYGVTDVEGFYIFLVTYELDTPVSNINEAKAALRSLAEDEFKMATYDYRFTTDNTLLVQKKLPENKGSNELKGKTFTRYGDVGEEFTFAVSGNTYIRKYGGDIWEAGIYAYDSNTKWVYLRPEKYEDMIILERYDWYNTNWPGAEEAAEWTNGDFYLRRTKYNPTNLKIGSEYSGSVETNPLEPMP